MLPELGQDFFFLGNLRVCLLFQDCFQKNVIVVIKQTVPRTEFTDRAIHVSLKQEIYSASINIPMSAIKAENSAINYQFRDHSQVVVEVWLAFFLLMRWFAQQ